MLAYPKLSKILPFFFRCHIFTLNYVFHVCVRVGAGGTQVLRAPTGLPDLGGASNLVDALFGLEMVTTDTCDECPEAEAPKVGAETSRKLVVNITGGNAAGAAVTGNVDHLHEGARRLRRRVCLSVYKRVERRFGVGCKGWSFSGV